MEKVSKDSIKVRKYRLFQPNSETFQWPFPRTIEVFKGKEGNKGHGKHEDGSDDELTDDFSIFRVAVRGKNSQQSSKSSISLKQVLTKLNCVELHTS